MLTSSSVQAKMLVGEELFDKLLEMNPVSCLRSLISTEIWDDLLRYTSKLNVLGRRVWKKYERLSSLVHYP